jgi:hypothetical protein
MAQEVALSEGGDILVAPNDEDKPQISVNFDKEDMIEYAKRNGDLSQCEHAFGIYICCLHSRRRREIEVRERRI